MVMGYKLEPEGQPVYNEHAQAPMTRASLALYKRFLSTCGMLDDLDDPENDENPTAPRV